MELMEAKKTVAAYLSGERVSSARLEQACQRIQADRHTLSQVGEELGLAFHSGCDEVRSQAAELAAMPADQRSQSFPEVTAHIESCSSCRQLVQPESSFWVEVVERGKRQLIEPLRAAIDAMGRLVNHSSELLPSVPLAPTSVSTFGEPGPVRGTSSGAGLEWTIPLQEGLELRLALRRWSTMQDLELEWELKGSRSRQLRLPDGQFELQPAKGEGSASPARRMGGTYLIKPGDWLAVVHCVGQSWELPLSVEIGDEALAPPDSDSHP